PDKLRVSPECRLGLERGRNGVRPCGSDPLFSQGAPMRRIATVSALAALAVGLPLLEAEAGNGCCRHGRRAALHYAPPPPPPSAWYNAPSRYYGVTANPWFAWRAYYDAQADVSFARRALRGRYYTA